MEQALSWLVHFTDQMGYLGLLIMTFIDATIIPMPIELTLIPVGYLIHQGNMHFIPALIVSVIGTALGSCFNYWLAARFGRSLFLRYGRYVMMPPEKLIKLELFFAEHGAISVFIGRLMPGLRHYIALPAGLARMSMRIFCIYSVLGGLVTATLLMLIGYVIGASMEAMHAYMPYIKLGFVALVGCVVVVYVLRYRWKKKHLSTKK